MNAISYAADLSPGKLLSLCRDPIFAKASCSDGLSVYRKSAHGTHQINVFPGWKALIGCVRRLPLCFDRHGVELRRAVGDIPLPHHANAASVDRFPSVAAFVRKYTDFDRSPDYRPNTTYLGRKRKHLSGQNVSLSILEGQSANAGATEGEPVDRDVGRGAREAG